MTSLTTDPLVLATFFQVVDMRWGVRDEATDDHMTTSICLEEIRNCQQVSISPTFYAQIFCTKVSRKAFLCLHLRFELFGGKNIGANALIKCWWNWPQVSISPTFYVHLYCTKVSHEAFLYLQFRFELFLGKNIGANALINC